VIREISEPVRAGHGDKFHVRAELLSEDGGEIDIESPWLHVRANRPERRVVLEDADSDHLGLSYPAERIGMGWRKQASDGEDQRDCGEAGVQRANGFHGAILEVCSGGRSLTGALTGAREHRVQQHIGAACHVLR
jgi:hypothetical protein